ncbi:hypothetical protein AVEN_251637-1 [Araneus ventricosus]|uniref:Uncharacterized protein n=1 Tax=Araneus ventricosus TaxID=182803 RepID=A0A4Y2FTM6_ARAVE|nr:hypothetical protein AVEN_251637-1 [Araneus ventricosus]
MQKGLAVLFAIVTFLCCFTWNAEGFTLPLCPESCDSVTNCPPVDECQCGSYKGFCGCCSYCFKCPGEACLRHAIDTCSPGTKCMKGKDVPGICQTP